VSKPSVTTVAPTIPVEAAYTLIGKRVTEALSAGAIAALSGAMAAVLFLPFALWQAWSFDFAAPSAGQ
jgi:threonine/homoserine efflux transporter RhtA